MKNSGKIIEPLRVNIRLHERKTAEALARAGAGCAYPMYSFALGVSPLFKMADGMVQYKQIQ